jgi:ribose transport system ATP-binding protein
VPGIRFVHQDLGLVGSLSTVENLALTAGYHTGKMGRIQWRNERRRAREALGELGLGSVDVKAPVSSLPPSLKTAVAIARAIMGWEDGASLLVLDEPTATLPGNRREPAVRGHPSLEGEGRLDPVRVPSPRRGVRIGRSRSRSCATRERSARCPVAGLDHGSLVELIVGHRIEATTATKVKITGEPALMVRNLHGGNVHGIDFDVYPGEIVGLAGITGSGREHVLDLIFGDIPRDDGVVLVDKTEVDNYQPRNAIDSAAAFVPSDRAIRGTVGMMSVRENLTLCDVSKNFTQGRIRRRREAAETREWIDRLAIKTSGPEAIIGSLSGGNQQKVMFGKALRLSPKVLLLNEPTQGIDIGAKDQIHTLVDDAARDGLAAVVASTDTDELVRLCHRVLVLIDGKVAATLVGDGITAERIEHTQLQVTRRGS